MTDTRTTVFEKDFATVWVYPDQGIIHHQFHRYIYGDDFQEMLMVSLENFRKYKCTGWLSDDRNFGAVLPKDKEWGDAVWRPQMLAAGWKYWAMVLPKKVTGQLNLKKMVEEYEALGVTASFHELPDSAYKWLVSQMK
ncbi:MAG: hypothetical protein JXX14_04135 [Deltaproteobacteria bacterium]|nr:hypothetical protein [Deltaproteobacteria bacterium]